jgi:7,8-dihydropterin-6-yl-methyl-4-(beta-D-ribofuranosyl)aminobenzene 5'-phosphate synthase
MRIQILVDNSSVSDELERGHGFAAFVETEEGSLLFDTGPDARVMRNAERLGVDWSTVQGIVLSHGHYDHTGGLVDVMAATAGQEAPVFMHPAALRSRYSIREGETPRWIGITDSAARALEQHKGRVRLVEDPREVLPGVWASGEIPRRTDFEDVGGPFFLDADRSIPDGIPDDMALYLESGDELVVLVGCAHAGIVNSIEYARELLPGRAVTAVLGGMHLVHASPGRIERTRDYLRELPLRQLAPMHCSGDSCRVSFAAKMGELLSQSAGVGVSFEL